MTAAPAPTTAGPARLVAPESPGPTGRPGTPRTAAGAALPVAFEALTRSFGSGDSARTVLAGIDFEVAAGEVLAILGPSGCGKSTLLRAVAGLDAPTSGRVAIGTEPVNGLDERTAVAFQEPRLLPWQSVRANVELGLPRGTSKAEAAQRVDELLELVELGPYAGHRPREISGGMAQRTSLARALARRPGVLLLDEPFGALDALTRLKMQDLLLDIHRAHPATVLLVTHDVDEALQLADRILVLGPTGSGQGAGIAQVLEVPGERPRDRASAELAALRSSLLETLGVDPHRR
ncbi:ABC transporter ATP-binding protein [Zafaria sp. Z1313]|uniref:ABC transporter ATP-binding protein n=1 Tax=unclassified Zafaria TaxID=2828765 RepID=UPI002E780453|nr:ABC transporter ATP-binding protein [Zafaria sp. J156]MEE1621761.1 ABC transporter ATP-binding protein [Zafaria sp. J156]